LKSCIEYIDFETNVVKKIDDKFMKQADEAIHNMASEALRTIAVAY
jgi:hypothetical protein